MSTAPVQDYKSSRGDPSSRRFGTFAYLPAMSPERIRAQVDYLVQRGWSPAIEHTEPQNADGSYWYMWKLPMFGETRAEQVLAEAAACHKAHPGNHVRLVGYDKVKQTQGAAMVIYRGRAV
jgi:ribulose-bisphosphate carboxylase small chain